MWKYCEELELILNKLALFFCFLAILPASAKVHVGVTHWDGYTNPDGTGVYIELLENIYGEQELVFDFTSYNRMTSLFDSTPYDMVVGIAPEDTPSAYFPKWHLDRDYPIRAFFKKKDHDFKHLSHLKGATLSWLHGYDFDKYIDFTHIAYPVRTVKSGFQLLMHDRIDAFVDFQYNVPSELLEQLGSIEIVPARPIYIAFKPTEKGKVLAKRFDEGMYALRTSGKLKALYQSDYQHAQFDSFDHEIPVITISTNDKSLLRLYSTENAQSLEAKLYRLILSQLSAYQVEFVGANYHRGKDVPLKSGCLANKVLTPERRREYLVSSPFAMYFSPRLYTLKNIKHFENTALEGIIDKASLTIGLPKARLLNRRLDNAIESVNGKRKTYISEFPSERLAALKYDQRINALIEFPADVATYWPYISDHDLFSLPLPNESVFTLGYMMCEANEVNTKFVTYFNDALKKAVASEAYFNAIQAHTVGISEEVLEKAYYDSFLRQK